jgi:hypothetical protein
MPEYSFVTLAMWSRQQVREKKNHRYNDLSYNTRQRMEMIRNIVMYLFYSLLSLMVEPKENYVFWVTTDQDKRREKLQPWSDRIL